MLTGQNGILKNAKEASYQTGLSELKDNIKFDILEKMTEKNGQDLSKDEIREILVNYFGENNVPATNDPKWDEFPKGYFESLTTEDGKYKVNMAEIYDANLGKMVAGEVTTVPEGKEDKWDLSKVTPVTDGTGNVIPVPKGFYYAGGTKDTGFVISDAKDDDLNNTKGGNQFVWVPCGEGEDEVTYEKKNGNPGTSWRTGQDADGTKYNTKQWYYTVYPSDAAENLRGKTITGWEDDGGDTPSVETYGGFYIGRFEAGIPSEAPFYQNQDGATYNRTGRGNQSETTTVASLKPVSKKNNPSWNLITQANAVTVSNSMYSDSSSVTSSLIDSYAWDTTVEWIKTGAGAVSKVTDSSTYGNYYNNTSIKLPTNGLYAMHAYRWQTSDTSKGTAWLYATKYSVGNWGRTASNKQITDGNLEADYSKYEWSTPKTGLDFNTYTYRERTEIATGAAEATETKNIYDLAGNMWEWTTEHGLRHVGDETIDATLTTDYAVIRGGSFYNAGSSHPVCHRHGNHTSGANYHFDIGFRVVLYIQ